MASRSKVKKYQSEIEGKIIDLQRFAYDVFVYSASKFQIPASCICKWEGKENNYGCCDFILALSRIFLQYQITLRYFLYSSFKSRYESNHFESFEDIREILQQVIKLSRKKAAGCILHEALVSLSVINEMIIFLYSENCNLYLKELARFWFQYLAPMKQKFEKAGGLSELYKTYKRPNFDSVDDFYDEFIPGFCFPYGDSEILSCLEDIFYTESDRYFRELSEFLPEEKRNEYFLIMHSTVWRDSINMLVSEHRKRVDEALRESAKKAKTSESVSLETAVEILEGKELLQEACVLAEAFSMLSQDHAGASCKQPKMERAESPGQVKRQEGKSSSLLRMEKDFEQLDLDSSDSKGASNPVTL